jgi:hypothetical protein
LNFTSDHHVVTGRIAKIGNEFNNNFTEKKSFNVDFETRQPKRTKKEKEVNFKVRDNNFDGKRREQRKQESENGQSKENLSSTECSNTINLNCLYSPNWLNDEVIDNYLKLLNTVDDSVFIYSTYFHQAFSEGGFEKVENYYRRYDPLSFQKILIPVHHGSHWFLITFIGTELMSLDPYNYPGATGRRKIELLKENLQLHTDILTNLRENYFKPLFKKYKKQYEEISIIVKLPPAIPAQNNGYDCGVFLLAFAKQILFRRNFDFCNDDMIFFRDTIRSELESKEIVLTAEPTRNKRKQNPLPKSPPKRKKRVQEKTGQRRIINPDAETCWLNSCLQLVLTTLDHKDDVSPTGSVLWNDLLWMQGKNPSVVLDPTDVKHVVLKTERQRIVRENVAPNHMLFDLGNLPICYDHTRQIRRDRIGQQDCKDFFYCLDENRQAWPDVFDLFKINTLSETECYSCNNVSTQEVSGNERTFITLTCPSTNVSMKHYIEDKMNGNELVQDWRDEDGCGKLSVGKMRTRITNIKETDYILFVLERLIRVDGDLHIVRTKVHVDEEEEIALFDINGEYAMFSPIAIIHHSGNVRGDTTQGHYRADVKNKEENCWYRTSDNDPPENLSDKGLTKMGYIFLYKKSAPKPYNCQEKDLFVKIIAAFDEMNADLVFQGI